MIYSQNVKTKDADNKEQPRHAPYGAYAWPVRQWMAMGDQTSIQIPQRQPQVAQDRHILDEAPLAMMDDSVVNLVEVWANQYPRQAANGRSDAHLWARGGQKRSPCDRGCARTYNRMSFAAGQASPGPLPCARHCIQSVCPTGRACLLSTCQCRRRSTTADTRPLGQGGQPSPTAHPSYR